MKFYRYLPEIIRLRDSLASGHPPEGTQEVDIPVGGASSIKSGNAVAFNWRRVTDDIILYVEYVVRFWISTDGGPYESARGSGDQTGLRHGGADVCPELAECIR